jgi:hypothetical protein
MTLRCLLTGTAPWPAQDLDLEMFAPLANEDLSAYYFADWRTDAVRTDCPAVVGAVYHRPDAALLLLGNLTGTPQTLRCTVDVGQLALRDSPRYRVSVADEASMEIDRAALTTEGVAVTVGGDNLIVVRIEPMEE